MNDNLGGCLSCLNERYGTGMSLSTLSKYIVF